MVAKAWELKGKQTVPANNENALELTLPSIVDILNATVLCTLLRWFNIVPHTMQNGKQTPVLVTAAAAAFL